MFGVVEMNRRRLPFRLHLFDSPGTRKKQFGMLCLKKGRLVCSKGLNIVGRLRRLRERLKFSRCRAAGLQVRLSVLEQQRFHLPPARHCDRTNPTLSVLCLFASLLPSIPSLPPPSLPAHPSPALAHLPLPSSLSVPVSTPCCDKHGELKMISF